MGMAVSATTAGMVPMRAALAAAAVGLTTTAAATASLNHGMIDDGATAGRRLSRNAGSRQEEND